MGLSEADYRAKVKRHGGHLDLVQYFLRGGRRNEGPDTPSDPADDDQNLEAEEVEAPLPAVRDVAQVEEGDDLSVEDRVYVERLFAMEEARGAHAEALYDLLEIEEDLEQAAVDRVRDERVLLQEEAARAAKTAAKLAEAQAVVDRREQRCQLRLEKKRAHAEGVAARKERRRRAREAKKLEREQTAAQRKEAKRRLRLEKKRALQPAAVLEAPQAPPPPKPDIVKPQPIAQGDGTCRVPIGGAHADVVVLIDEADASSVGQHRWSLLIDRRRGRRYVRTISSGRQFYLQALLHPEMPEGHEIMFRNGNSLDLRRSNPAIVPRGTARRGLHYGHGSKPRKLALRKH